MGDDQTLRSYPGLGDGAVIYLVRRPLSLRICNLLQATPTEFSVTLGHNIKVVCCVCVCVCVCAYVCVCVHVCVCVLCTCVA